MSIKEKITQEVDKTKTVAKNFQRLVEALSLLALGGFTAYVLLQELTIANQVKYGLLVSSAIVFTRGLYEFIKFLGDRK